MKKIILLLAISIFINLEARFEGSRYFPNNNSFSVECPITYKRKVDVSKTPDGCDLTAFTSDRYWMMEGAWGLSYGHIDITPEQVISGVQKEKQMEGDPRFQNSTLIYEEQRYIGQKFAYIRYYSGIKDKLQTVYVTATLCYDARTIAFFDLIFEHRNDNSQTYYNKFNKFIESFECYD